MKAFPIRLPPGQDLRSALEAAVHSQNCRAAFVLSGIGSLSPARCWAGMCSGLHVADHG